MSNSHEKGQLHPVLPIRALLMCLRKCDDEATCTECATTGGKEWMLGCQRGELADNLQGILPSKLNPGNFTAIRS
jgi:hypothetical protein